MPLESKRRFIDYFKNFNYEKLGSLIALAALFIISGIANPIFFRPLNIMNILRQISYVGTIALGMTFVIISGGIDLSVGSLMALLGGIMIIVINQFGGNVLAILIAMVVGAGLSVVLGLGTGLLITKGKIAAIDTPERLKRTFEETQSVEVSFDGFIDDRLIRESNLVKKTEKLGDKLKLYTDNPDKLIKYLIRIAQQKDATFTSMRICGASLEDVFVKLTESKDYAN